MSSENSGVLIAVITIITIIVIVAGIGIVYYFMSVDDKITVGDLVEFKFNSNLGSLCSDNSGSTIRVMGVVTKVTDNQIGVTWNLMVNEVPKLGLTAVNCTWNRTGKTTAWIADWLGTDTVNPIVNTQLKSVFTTIPPGFTVVKKYQSS
jgi:hypothetical protein